MVETTAVETAIGGTRPVPLISRLILLRALFCSLASLLLVASVRDFSLFM